MTDTNETTTGADNPNAPTAANIKRNIERALRRLDSITGANAAPEIEAARGLLRICKADIEHIEQPGERIADGEQIKEIGYMHEIRLTREQAADLSEWIFTTDYGIFSADAFDDRAKQALLIILAAAVYDDDATNRENIFIDVAARIFGYSFAANAAQNEFIRAGFLAYTGGEWKPAKPVD